MTPLLRGPLTGGTPQVAGRGKREVLILPERNLLKDEMSEQERRVDAIADQMIRAMANMVEKLEN